MARYLSQEEIAAYRECFNLYDKKRNGRIRTSDLTKVMRSLGSCPTPTEIKKHLERLNKKPKDEIEFDEFLTVMHEQSLHEDPQNEILRAMQAMDTNGRGKMPASRLRHILMHTGEQLNQREVDQMFRAANVNSSGYIDYADFTKMVTQPIPDY